MSVYNSNNEIVLRFDNTVKCIIKGKRKKRSDSTDCRTKNFASHRNNNKRLYKRMFSREFYIRSC